MIHRKLQMLRSDTVRHLHGLVQVIHCNQGAAAAQGAADHVAPLHLGQQLVHAIPDVIQEIRVRAQQDGLGIFVVLGLGKQIHGHPVRVRVTVTDDEDL